jgi:predicted methyltransferase
VRSFRPFINNNLNKIANNMPVMDTEAGMLSSIARPYTISLRPIEVTQFERSIETAAWLEHLAKEKRSEKVRRALAAAQKLTHSEPETVRKASLAAANKILSEMELLQKQPSRLTHFTDLLYVLAELQVLRAALAELETGPRGGEIILVRAMDLKLLAQELSETADKGESLEVVETAVKHIVELNSLKATESTLQFSHQHPLTKNVK